uniref:4Fe-4S ferredoxin-type domain-containing protein n=1 Tax=Aegilops tauschii subsp. strangulata TaxID=200361 RepID=A0A453NFP0_AEGTS
MCIWCNCMHTCPGGFIELGSMTFRFTTDLGQNGKRCQIMITQ